MQENLQHVHLDGPLDSLFLAILCIMNVQKSSALVSACAVKSATAA